MESEIDAATTSTATMASLHMRKAVEGMRRDLQAELEKNLAESRRREEEARNSVATLTVKLQQLTHQLNEYNPIRESDAVARAHN